MPKYPDIIISITPEMTFMDILRDCQIKLFEADVSENDLQTFFKEARADSNMEKLLTTVNQWFTVK